MPSLTSAVLLPELVGSTFGRLCVTLLEREYHALTQDLYLHEVPERGRRLQCLDRFEFAQVGRGVRRRRRCRAGRVRGSRVFRAGRVGRPAILASSTAARACGSASEPLLS